MTKILFFIHDLGQGGAEKVLVNLVNNMDRSKFDITVMAQFGGGVNEQFLAPHIKYVCCHKRAFRGNSHIMKLFSPKTLYKHYIKEHYDIAVSYLEGPSARIISGCPDPDTKLVSWIHSNQNEKSAAEPFRSMKEALKCYRRFDRTICVAQSVLQNFTSLFSLDKPAEVLYNTNETDKIIEMSDELICEGIFCDDEVNLIGVGSLKPVKGFDRFIRIHEKLLRGGYPVHTYILGNGCLKDELEKDINNRGLKSSITLLGYQTNPYKYVKGCDLFVCASHAEGFSTAATEALIVGTPVCTVEVSGMKEMLGDNNEYGVVTENTDEALYEGIKRLLNNSDLLEHYKRKAIERGKFFSTEQTVKAVEQMLLSLLRG